MIDSVKEEMISEIAYKDFIIKEQKKEIERLRGALENIKNSDLSQMLEYSLIEDYVKQALEGGE